MIDRTTIRLVAAGVALTAFSASAIADLRSDVASGAALGASRFHATYPHTGVAGAFEEIGACYKGLARAPSTAKLAECAGYDITAANADAVMSRSFAIPARPHFAERQIDSRIVEGAGHVGLSAAERAEFQAAVMASLNGETVAPPAASGANGAARSSAPPPARSAAVELATLDGVAYDHNGSTVVADPAKGLIVYARPKRSIAGTVKPGFVLFRGKPWSMDDPDRVVLEGVAYTFKKGCEPAEYAVRGRFHLEYRMAQFSLEGHAPVRSKSSCAVARYTSAGAHSSLVFHAAWDD